MAGQNKQEQEQPPIVAETSSSSEYQQQRSVVDPTNYLLLQHPPSIITTTTTPLLCCCNNNNNYFLKRRSPSPSSSAIAANDEQHYRPCKKKLFREHHHQEEEEEEDQLCTQQQQQQQLINLNGFSAISLFPLNYHSHGTFQNPCGSGSSCCLSPVIPLSRNFLEGGFVCCDPSSSPPADTAENGRPVFTNEQEPSNSMKLRRIKGCLREMRKQWEEVMREGEEEDPEGAEGDDGLLSKDKCEGEGDAEEAVSVEWAGKCLIICFKCPCTKAHQIRLFGNICYHKLV